MKLRGRLLAGRDRGWDDTPNDPAVRAMDDLAAGPLSPDDETLGRMKSAALTAFREANAYRVAEMAVSTRPRRAAPRRIRFAAAGMAVALMTVSGVGFAAAESGPAEPFYRPRLAIEAWFLPPAGSDARLDADLDRAQARLAEATAAASRSDWNAEADAVGAYTDVVASISIPGDAAATERLRERLGQQLQNLEQLRTGSQGGAGQRLGQAVDSVDSLLRRAGNQPSATPGGQSGQSGQGGQGGQGGQQASPAPGQPTGGQGGQSGQGGQPSSSAGAAASPKPAGSGAAGSPQPGGSGQGGPAGSSEAGGTGQGGPGGH